MNVRMVTTAGDENIFDCEGMSFEGGFIVFDLGDKEELFTSPAKIGYMKITGRIKKKEEKPKATKKSSGGQ